MPRHSICSLAPIAGRANMDLIRNQIDGVVPYRDIFLVPLLIFLDGCCACVYSVCSKLFNCGKYLFSSDISDWAHQDSEVTPESQCWEIPTPAAVLMRWILIKVGFDWNPTTSWSLPHLVFPQRAHIWRAAGTTYHPNYSSQPLNLLFMPSLWGVSSFGPQIYEFKLFFVVKWSLKWQ